MRTHHLKFFLEHPTKPFDPNTLFKRPDGTLESILDVALGMGLMRTADLLIKHGAIQSFEGRRKRRENAEN
jgi:hypothetical protein